MAGSLRDNRLHFRPQRVRVTGSNFLEVIRIREKPWWKSTVHGRDGNLKPQIGREFTFVPEGLENEIRVQRIARETEAPAALTECDAVNARLSCEQPVICEVPRVEPFDAVLRRRMSNCIDLCVARQHLIVHATDPVAMTGRPHHLAWCVETAPAALRTFETTSVRVVSSGKYCQLTKARTCVPR